jgi:hypothetical protein
VTQPLLISTEWQNMPRTKTTQLVNISIFSLKQQVTSIHDTITELKWMECGEEKRVVIEVFVETTHPYVMVSEDYEGGFRPMQRILLTTTSCHFGSFRYWFRCLCGARVAILYKLGSLFLCRHCGDLAYPLQQATHTGRWEGFYRSLQGINWTNKINQTRTKIWKGSLTKRQGNRYSKLLHLNNTSDGDLNDSV